MPVSIFLHFCISSATSKGHILILKWILFQAGANFMENAHICMLKKKNER